MQYNSPLFVNPCLLWLMGISILPLWRRHFQHFCGSVSFLFHMPPAPAVSSLGAVTPKMYPIDMKRKGLLPGASPSGCPFHYKDQVFPHLKTRHDVMHNGTAESSRSQPSMKQPLRSPNHLFGNSGREQDSYNNQGNARGRERWLIFPKPATIPHSTALSQPWGEQLSCYCSGLGWGWGGSGDPVL